MTASWAAVLISAAVAAISVAAMVYRGGRRDGKIDAILGRLVELGEDHELRIRDIETGRHRRIR